VKVFISFDMEGVAGIVDWSQCLPPGQPYEEGRRLLLGEVNAAIDGALSAGATEIVCNDSHGTMNNLDPELLHGRATYVSGRHKPLYMMQDLETGADVAFLVGYHGSISGESSVLSHTYNPSVVSHVALNGVLVGESGINALVALAYGVPVGLVTGDRQGRGGGSVPGRRRTGRGQGVLQPVRRGEPASGDGPGDDRRGGAPGGAAGGRAEAARDQPAGHARGGYADGGHGLRWPRGSAAPSGPGRGR
jgi:hypothetical protein